MFYSKESIKDEKEHIANVLDDLCSPCDTYG